MSIRPPDFHDRRSFTRYTTKDSSAVMLEPGNVVSCVLLNNFRFWEHNFITGEQ